MKRLHLVLLLAGVLAVGSAFTTTSKKVDCSTLSSNQKLHRTSTTYIPFANDGGECNSAAGGICVYTDIDMNGVPENPCDEPTGVYQLPGK